MERDPTSGDDTAAGDAFRRFVVPELPVLVRVARRITGSAADAEEHVLDGLLDPELAAALAGLSDDHRAVVVLVDVDGLSREEAAQVLGVPRGTS